MLVSTWERIAEVWLLVTHFLLQLVFDWIMFFYVFGSCTLISTPPPRPVIFKKTV